MSECCNQSGRANEEGGPHRDKSMDKSRRVGKSDYNEGLARAYGIDSPGSLGGALRAPSKQGPDTLGITFDPNDFV